MAWNHKSRIVAVAVAIQVAAGAFTAPNTTTDLIAVAPPQNSEEVIEAEDPTATGTIWTTPAAYLGKTASMTLMAPMEDAKRETFNNLWQEVKAFYAS